VQDPSLNLLKLGWDVFHFLCSPEDSFEENLARFARSGYKFLLSSLDRVSWQCVGIFIFISRFIFYFSDIE